MSGYELEPDDPRRLLSDALAARDTQLPERKGEGIFSRDALLTAISVLGISGAAPTTMTELLALREVSNEPAQAPLFGYDVDYNRNFSDAVALSKDVPSAAGSIALTTAHAFSLSILPHLPQKDVVIAASDLTTYAWSLRSQATLRAASSREQYRKDLFDPTNKVEGDLNVLNTLADAGRTDSLKMELELEEWLLKGAHFLSGDDQFRWAQSALNPTHPDGKTITTVPFDITSSGKYGFDAWVSRLSAKTGGLITWANLSDIGDYRTTNLQTALGQNVTQARRTEGETQQQSTNERWPIAEDCIILSSTRVHYEDETNSYDFMGTWEANQPPHTNLDTSREAFNFRLARGTTAYPVR